MYSSSCNPSFIAKETEQGFPQEFDHLSDMEKDEYDDNIYVMFEPKDTTACATSDCSEFKYEQSTLTRPFKGKHGTYPDRGYFIDFTCNKAANLEKITKL